MDGDGLPAHYHSLERRPCFLESSEHETLVPSFLQTWWTFNHAISPHAVKWWSPENNVLVCKPEGLLGWCKSFHAPAWRWHIMLFCTTAGVERLVQERDGSWPLEAKSISIVLAKCGIHANKVRLVRNIRRRHSRIGVESRWSAGRREGRLQKGIQDPALRHLIKQC